jgi:methylmalonyl-CoA mutase cobalamin-binding subunit
MTFERKEGAEPEKTLKSLVEKFSKQEGRQPRAMICRSRECEADEKIKQTSVDLAGYGFDVDIGIPFDSFVQLGMNAIENDADLLILFGPEGNQGKEFMIHLEEFFSEKGYPDLLILHLPLGFTPSFIRETLSNWLGHAFQ